MALSNTSHNLTEPHSAEQQTPGIKQVLPLLSLDETIEQIMGGFGWSQFLQAILVSVPTFFDAQLGPAEPYKQLMQSPKSPK